MTPDIFQKALRATAQVACCAILLACPRPVQTPDEKVTATSTQTKPDKEPAASAPDEAPTSAPDKEPTAPEKAPAMTLEQCKAHTNAVFSTKTEKQTSYTKECCQRIAEDQDKAQKFSSGWPERGQCCELLEWRGSMACTPWGPPCPPAMGEA